MHFKRKRPKEHLFIDCCRSEAGYGTGNHRHRVKVRDLRQPQFTDGEHHANKVWRYHNSMLR